LQDIPGHDGFGLGGRMDFARAWREEEPFLFLKNSMYDNAYSNDDFRFDYPYESIFNQVCAIGMVKEAHKKDALVEVRYGWEPLDSDNIMMHSCIGMIIHPAILIDAKDAGFIMELQEETSTVCAFKYRDIFWVAPVRD
jgi:hypothetical protein